MVYRKWLALAALLLPLSGCTTPITMLTPQSQPRNAAGLYPVEISWDNHRQNLRKESIHPSVLIGIESYPMRPIPAVRNRWETLVPVPANVNSIGYRVRIDYQYDAFPASRSNAEFSPNYLLNIVGS